VNFFVTLALGDRARASSPLTMATMGGTSCQQRRERRRPRSVRRGRRRANRPRSGRQRARLQREKLGRPHGQRKRNKGFAYKIAKGGGGGQPRRLFAFAAVNAPFARVTVLHPRLKNFLRLRRPSKDARARERDIAAAIWNENQSDTRASRRRNFPLTQFRARSAPAHRAGSWRVC